MAIDYDISIKLFRPTFVPFVPKAFLYKTDIAPTIDSYSQQIDADGGFISGNISFRVPIEDAEEWYRNGLALFVLVQTGDGDAFEALVDLVTVQAGPMSKTNGPLSNIWNRIIGIYNPLFVDAFPNIRGDTRVTPISGDSDSQSAWGIREMVLQIGDAAVSFDSGTPFNLAEQARDSFLAANKDPDRSSNSFSSSGVSVATVNLDLIGVISFLDLYYYNNTSNYFTTISGGGKLEDVLAADINSAIQYNDNTIDANPVLIQEEELDYRKAREIIAEMRGLGGGSFEPWFFGVYGEQLAYFKPQETVTRYALSITKNAVQVQDLKYGRYIHPAMVRPNNWAVITDFLQSSQPTRATEVDPSDPRVGFIRSCGYDFPNVLSLNGEKVSTLAQMAAQLGLGGL